MAKLKIGVIGGGHIVDHRHLPVFKKLADVEVEAICDKQESIAKKTAEKFGIKRYYSDLSDMLKKEKLDIVDVCTPPKTHLALATEALEAGCNVLAEKPLAMNVNDVNEMYKLAQANNVKLCVVHQNLFNPAVQKARRLVNDGTLGEIISADVGTFVRRDNYMCLNGKHWCHTLPGGIFFEILPHPVYLLQLFSRNAVPSSVVTGKLSGFSWMKVDELKVLIKAEKNVGSIVASCNSPYHGDSLNIMGTKLGIQVDLWGRSVIKYKPRTEDPVSVGKANLSLASQLFGLLGANLTNMSRAVFGGVKVSAHYYFLLEFVKSIINGSPPPVSPEEAKENVKIVENICNQIDKNVS
jgi:predicted dehydrogenase